ncbi:unnamed protein product [Adineta steineri]|uniref:Uncharacterized protein n=1 Tax=Adineta steineri TaxID=433720 RepID=A0A813MK84_9BILA|nr:unnamed protein product [Adineta steineri]CAF4011485.1 unnamed protein product [Adineta steineri]
MHPKQQLYNLFLAAYVNLHKDLKKEIAFHNGQKAWNEIKQKGQEAIQNEIAQMSTKVKINQPLSSPIQMLWKKQNNSSLLASPVLHAASSLPTTTSASSSPSATSTSLPSTTSTSSLSSTSSETQVATTSSSFATTSSETSRECFKQNSVQNELNAINEQIAALTNLKTTGLWRSENAKELNDLMKKRSKIKQSLNRLKLNQQCQARMRVNRRLRMSRLLDNHPELIQEISSIARPEPGRPNIEDSQPGLLGTILDIANCGVVAADSRRRTDAVQSCLTLDSLKEQLNNRGYELSRTATYYRLLPKCSRSIDGQRHVHTVPVRIRRPENSLHKYHDDTKFAQSSIRDIKQIAYTLGNQAVFYLSQDDKCRIPMGIPAAHKQAPLIMSMKIQIKLPDHDFAVGTKHKLIPSIYGACLINEERVTYSGPTFAAIRSGKHDHSSALGHAKDFDTLIQLPEFEKAALIDGNVKPVVIISVDGGPDENPRYPKTIYAATALFKKYDLDALFVATNAPGRSAFNEVERRMAPLSHELSGLILPHDYYGNHLDESGRTTDPQLELQNFKRAN